MTSLNPMPEDTWEEHFTNIHEPVSRLVEEQQSTTRYDELAGPLENQVLEEPPSTLYFPTNLYPTADNQERSARQLGTNLPESLQEEEESVTLANTLPCTSAMRFEDLNLPPELLKNLYVDMKFERPTKIQSISLPMILTPPYVNLMAESHTGSGKTTCSVMGMLARVDPNLHFPQVICLCPTSELAIQGMNLFTKMGKDARITIELGIPNIRPYLPINKRSLVKAKAIIGTAGTVSKLIAGEKLDTSYVRMLVFDDADHMLIEGASKEDSVRIMMDIHKKNPECKVLLYASIFNDRVKAFVYKIVDVLKVEQYTQLVIKKDGPALDLVKQYKVNVPDEDSKIMFIINKILELGEFMQPVIFVRTKESAERLHKALHDASYNATNFLGACTQGVKDLLFEEYKGGLTQILITNDVHARGIDLAQANLVINYDLPIASDSTDDCELYLHRIGRVGRHHKKGVVFNFPCGAVDNNLMEKFVKYNKNNIVEVPYEISDEEFEVILAGR